MSTEFTDIERTLTPETEGATASIERKITAETPVGAASESATTPKIREPRIIVGQASYHSKPYLRTIAEFLRGKDFISLMKVCHVTRMELKNLLANKGPTFYLQPAMEAYIYHNASPAGMIYISSDLLKFDFLKALNKEESMKFVSRWFQTVASQAYYQYRYSALQRTSTELLKTKH